MADFSSVPVIDVHDGNFERLWPMLISAVRTATFVAVDTELSGLGFRKKLFAKDMDERYKNMCEVAKTRSIIALGISCFQHTPLNMTQGFSISNNFLAQTFNILLLCNKEYMVDPSSLRFLVDHGFDFNTQYSLGIQYQPSPSKEDDINSPSIHRLFSELMFREVPLVFHNGIVDLVFIYESFHCPLPASMSTFLADLSLMFAGGLYDTKFIAEFQARAAASYLEYVFRKCQRTNMENSERGEHHVTMSFLSYSTTMANVNYLPCGLQGTAASNVAICENYASHGWCTDGPRCSLSHDVDLIISKEDDIVKKKRKKRRRKKKAMEEMENECNHDNESVPDEEKKDEQMDTGDAEPDTNEMQATNEAEDTSNTAVLPTNGTDHGSPNDTDHGMQAGSHPVKEGRTEGHRAGFDAFMTAFAFACYLTSYSQSKTLHNAARLADFDMTKFVNKLSLSGKDIPLQIMKSSFSKPSRKHRERMDYLRKKFSQT